MQLVWSTNIIQSESPSPAKRFLLSSSLPDARAPNCRKNLHLINKWELETLVNEKMTTPERGKQGKQVRSLRWDHFGSSVNCVNLLRRIEDLEFKAHKQNEDIFLELGRIAARQFDWQRGFVNLPQFYRNAFVYGQGECASFFESQYGITLDRFSQIGFVMFVCFSKQPVLADNGAMEKLNIGWEEVEKTLALVGARYVDAAKLARTQRKATFHISDKASVLRRSPCLRFGANGERVRAPLPELILERITSGVFYDVIDGGGPVRDDYGRRFEQYCFQYLKHSLPELNWQTEFKYKKKPNTLDTPDILCLESGKVRVAIECKSTRMSHGAMFGKKPFEERGYKDLVKAVFQLWRFFSHCRRGYTKLDLNKDAVGVVLTLDNWLVMAETLQEQVMQAADELAQKKDPEILAEDKRAVQFVAIPEMERTLSLASSSSFLTALEKASSSEFKGWRLDGVHSKFADEHATQAKYPFADSLGDLLPWWDRMGRARPTLE